MEFIIPKRRQPPAVIIVSLIDVLLVVLIFLMVTTTFKQQPAVNITLPQSREIKTGATQTEIIVTVPKTGPIYLKTEPVTFDTLQQRLIAAARENPKLTLAIRADKETPIGQVLRVRDAATAANIPTVNVWTSKAQ